MRNLVGLKFPSFHRFKVNFNNVVVGGVGVKFADNFLDDAGIGAFDMAFEADILQDFAHREKRFEQSDAFVGCEVGGGFKLSDGEMELTFEGFVGGEFCANFFYFFKFGARFGFSEFTALPLSDGAACLVVCNAEEFGDEANRGSRVAFLVDADFLFEREAKLFGFWFAAHRQFRAPEVKQQGLRKKNRW